MKDWDIKKDKEYTIIYTVRVLPQNLIGVTLSEIELTKDECFDYILILFTYNYFLNLFCFVIFTFYLNCLVTYYYWYHLFVFTGCSFYIIINYFLFEILIIIRK